MLSPLQAAAALIAGLALLAPPAVWLLVRSEGPEARGLSAAEFEQKTGVEVVRVALTGGGGMLDVRFRVLNSGRAWHVHHHPPAVIEEETGDAVTELWMGHMHKGKLRVGKTHYLLFVKGASTIKQGSRVSVQLAHDRLASVLVQ